MALSTPLKWLMFAIFLLTVIIIVVFVLTIIVFIRANNKSTAPPVTTLPPTPKPTTLPNNQTTIITNPPTTTQKPTTPTQPPTKRPAQHSVEFQSAANRILANLDPTADPCQDFFQHACGNFPRNNPLSPGQGGNSVFSDLANAVSNNLTATYNSINKNPAKWPKSVQLAAKIYQACVNSNDTHDNDPQPLLNAIKSLQTNGWPIITKNWNKMSTSFEALIAQLEVVYDTPTLLSSGVDVNWKNIVNNALYIDQGTLGLGSREYYINPIFANAINYYKQHIINVATSLSSGISPQLIAQDAQDIVNYEIKVARYMAAMTDRRSAIPQYNAFTLTGLNDAYPFNWQDYLTHMFGHQSQALQKNLGQRIIMLQPSFVDQFPSDLMDTSTVSHNRTLANYLIWRLVMNSEQFLPAQLQEEFLQLKNSLRTDGKTDLPPSSGVCVDILTNYMPYAAGYAYVTDSFPQVKRNDIEEMVTNVLSALSTMFTQVPWMDEKTLHSAEKKATNILQHVGYPDWNLQVDKLDAYYNTTLEMFETFPNTWFHTLSILQNANRIQMYSQLNQPATRHDFGGSPATINAWYQPERNNINFPAAFLNPPFYQYGYPKAAIYGALGVVMGHEISHAFDDQGSEYNYNGTLAPWMTPKAKLGFANMAQCLISEYNQYCFPEVQNLCINGINTQGENIADNAGVQAAHKALKIAMAVSGDEGPLPGLEQYTTDQIFFLAYGNVWCSQASPGALQNQLLTDVHSPAKQRINAVLKNLDLFGTTWNCPRSSQMLPQESQQCHVYRPIPPNPPMPTPTPKPTPAVSTATGWKAASKILTAARNTSADPCNDFFSYACGGWQKLYPIPSHSSSISTYGQTATAVFEQVIANLGKVGGNPSSYPKSMATAYTFYKSCISSADNQFPNAKPLLQTLNGNNVTAMQFNTNGWPFITPKWKEPPAQYSPWNQIGQLATNYLTQTLLSSYITIDYKNVKANALYIDQGTTALGNRQFYQKKIFKSMRDNYLQLIISASTTLATDANPATSITPQQIAQDAADILSFEKSLANYLVSGSDRRNYTLMFNPMSIAQLQQKWSFVNWQAYISQSIKPHTVNFSSSLPFRIVVNQISYLDNLKKLLKNRNNRTLINYLGWRYVYGNMEFMGPKYRNLLVKFRNSQDSHVTALPPGSMSCVGMLIDLMPFVGGRLYVQPTPTTNFVPKALQTLRTDVAFQTNRLINGFIQMLQVLPWMDKKTKQAAITKASGIIHNIGYPDWILDNAKLDSYAIGYINSITSSSGGAFYSNMINMNTQYSATQSKMLFQPGNRRYFAGSPSTENAWYQPERNSITFPLADLASPFYVAGFPQAFNYGGQGGVGGHELTHGFDDEGVQFFTNGTLYNWMTPQSAAGFHKMAKCVVDQYSRYCYQNLTGHNNQICINGETTQGENIADIGGIQAAHIAYKNYLAYYGTEARLPGLQQYTMDQIFYLTYAYGWCESRTDSATSRQLIVDVHSPAKWRVNGVLRDIPAFAKAFQCRVGIDQMAPLPENTCKVW